MTLMAADPNLDRLTCLVRVDDSGFDVSDFYPVA